MKTANLKDAINPKCSKSKVGLGLRHSFSLMQLLNHIVNVGPKKKAIMNSFIYFNFFQMAHNSDHGGFRV